MLPTTITREVEPELQSPELIHILVAMGILLIDGGFLLVLILDYDTFCLIWMVCVFWFILSCMIDAITQVDGLTPALMEIRTFIAIVMLIIIIGTATDRRIDKRYQIQIEKTCHTLVSTYNITFNCNNISDSCFGSLKLVASAYQNKTYLC